MLRKIILYGTLTICALISLVPFAYMISSAIKPKSVLFNAPFLPTDGLFAIDRSTGELSVVDVNLLPPEGESRVYEVQVTLSIDGEVQSKQTLSIGAGPGSASADFQVPASPQVNQSLGRVRLSADGEIEIWRRDRPDDDVGINSLPIGPADRADTIEPDDVLDAAGPSDVGDADMAGGAVDAADADVVDGETGPADADSVPAELAASGIDPEEEAEASNAAEANDAVLLPQFEITDGNPRGTAGIAWGLLTTDNFDRLFNGVPPDGNPDGEPIPTGVWRAIVNSFFFASVSSVLATLGAAMGGYALAKFRFRGRELIDNLVLAAIVIPGALLIAPGYQLLYWFGLLDSYAGLILPGIAPAFGVFLFRQAFKSSLPDEMMEASRIDGCGEIRMFFTIALPMARPMVGAFLLITYLGAWNNFISPQIILQSPDKYPLAVWIGQLRGLYGIDYGLIMAGTLVAIAPVLILFLMLQKEFIAGLTAGAVKG
jgi:ABC-type glycerol-3-phosphate transport system permease component